MNLSQIIKELKKIHPTLKSINIGLDGEIDLVFSDNTEPMGTREFTRASPTYKYLLNLDKLLWPEDWE